MPCLFTTQTKMHQQVVRVSHIVVLITLIATQYSNLSNGDVSPYSNYISRKRLRIGYSHVFSSTDKAKGIVCQLERCFASASHSYSKSIAGCWSRSKCFHTKISNHIPFLPTYVKGSNHGRSSLFCRLIIASFPLIATILAVRDWWLDTVMFFPSTDKAKRIVCKLERCFASASHSYSKSIGGCWLQSKCFHTKISNHISFLPTYVKGSNHGRSSLCCRLIIASNPRLCATGTSKV
jgi:hypothetical protein